MTRLRSAASDGAAVVIETRTAIEPIIKARLAELGQTQEWLAVEVSRVAGRETPWRQSTVSGWILGQITPGPEALFAMERVLGLRPGDLSRHYGYQPNAAKPSGPSVPEAINADPRLSAQARRLLLAVYRELVED